MRSLVAFTEVAELAATGDGIELGIGELVVPLLGELEDVLGGLAGLGLGLLLVCELVEVHGDPFRSRGVVGC